MQDTITIHLQWGRIGINFQTSKEFLALPDEVLIARGYSANFIKELRVKTKEVGVNERNGNNEIQGDQGEHPGKADRS